MTKPDPEDRLQQLFDATSEEPSQAELDRMARAAAQIPERAGRRLPFGLTWPRLGLAFAGLAAAVALVVVELGNGSPTDAPVASLSPSATGTALIGPDDDALVATLAASSAMQDGMAWIDDDSAELPAVIDDPLNVLDGDPIPDPAAPLDLLVVPSDAYLDRYIASYERMLQDG